MPLEQTFVNNSVDYSQDGIYELYGYKYKVVHDRLWLRLFHHNATNNDFFPESSMCYNLNENAYSIISDFPYTNLPLKKFTYLLEYKSIPSFQIWRQDNYINDTNVSNYRYVKGDKWTDFSGLSLSLQENCLDYTGQGENFWYSIGTKQHNNFYPYIPGPIINSLAHIVKFADLWVMIQYMKVESCKMIQPMSRSNLIYFFVIIFLDD